MNKVGGKVAAITGAPKGIGASISTAYVEPSIDEYLRERLTPVEGVNPHLPGIEMYGNSIPAGMIGGDLFEYINFQQRYDIDARIQQAMKRSEEYLSPLPPGESPRNSVDDHAEWLKSRSSYRSGMETEYRGIEPQEAPSRCGLPKTCTTSMVWRASCWWTLRGMESFQRRLHPQSTTHFMLSCSPNSITRGKRHRSYLKRLTCEWRNPSQLAMR